MIWFPLDIPKHRWYITSMKKTTIYFQQIIRKNQKALIASGLNWTTVRSWAYGARMPSYESAQKIAEVLGVPVEEIHYRKIEYNRP